MSVAVGPGRAQPKGQWALQGPAPNPGLWQHLGFPRKSAHLQALAVPLMIPIESQWLGYLAAALTTGSFVPQAWHSFRSSDLSGISLSMYSAFTLGVALWLLYGLSLGEWPIIIANAITLALAGTILLRTWRARRRQPS